MGDLLINCPLCCDKTFSSKQSLLEHLNNILDGIICPICNNKWDSLVNLIEHISLDDCQPDINCTTIQNYETQIDEGTNENQIYVEIVDKQPGIQTQELKLVKENGESRYVIVPQEDGMLNEDDTIVTKQNNDGTISLTTVKDIKTESEGLLSSVGNSPEESQEEIYSCNTCKVSFSSVLEHIQNYHNNQDVVVEEPIEDDSPSSYEVPFVDEDLLSPSDKQAPRRVITDTGDIVEESSIFESDLVYHKEDQLIESNGIVKDKDGRVYTKQYIKVDKPITQDEKKISYHKVTVTEGRAEDGSMTKVFKCMSCNRVAHAIDHFKHQPCKNLKYPCPHCPVAYENSKSLCAHMKVHKSKTVGTLKVRTTTFECETCWTVFPTNKSLKLHMRMHEPVKSHPIEPPVENTDGTEVSEVRFHCSVCDKMIPEDYKTIHMNSHKPSDTMNCSICNKKFSSPEYLEMHMNVHNMDKVTVNNQDKSLPYSCLYCDRRFARPHEKVKHERIHTGEKPHSCEICGKSFRVSYCLTLHMRTHTGARPYACKHCGKRFKAHSVYNHHLLIHSEVRAYKCPFCPKAFKTAVQLAGHKNSHTKPFSCQQCNRPFASLYAVRVHTETHARQNNLKFSCTLCGASYARAFALKDHVKQVHKQDIDSVESMTNPEGDSRAWVVKDEVNAETEGVLSNSLQNEISDLGMSANELIVP